MREIKLQFSDNVRCLTTRRQDFSEGSSTKCCYVVYITTSYVLAVSTSEMLNKTSMSVNDALNLSMPLKFNVQILEKQNYLVQFLGNKSQSLKKICLNISSLSK